jgi:hypothetical protein
VVLDEPGSEVSQSIRSLAVRFTGTVSEMDEEVEGVLNGDVKTKKKASLFGRRKS